MFEQLPNAVEGQLRGWVVLVFRYESRRLDEHAPELDAGSRMRSCNLNELDRETSCAIVRGNRRGLKTDGFQAERENRRRRASVRDSHSFRVTWITLALGRSSRG